ncbi:hypothetical protein OH76DRAFT_901478 [Lentinus brumalis]|uniref:Uncharacterized protein n=1 Tax=Lentinus brumalis TaxID=2498619 RepID=A0A371D0Y9_9APHY|nr:hypothetical protein OH76DRAFT_901478 [Polyporus brumalis]
MSGLQGHILPAPSRRSPLSLLGRSRSHRAAQSSVYRTSSWQVHLVCDELPSSAKSLFQHASFLPVSMSLRLLLAEIGSQPRRGRSRQGVSSLRRRCVNRDSAHLNAPTMSRGLFYVPHPLATRVSGAANTS